MDDPLGLIPGLGMGFLDVREVGVGDSRELVREKEFLGKFMANLRDFRYQRSSIDLPGDVTDD